MHKQGNSFLHETEKSQAQTGGTRLRRRTDHERAWQHYGLATQHARTNKGYFACIGYGTESDDKFYQVNSRHGFAEL